MEITWDLFILIVFGSFVIYSAFISKNKIMGVLVNIYIAIAVTLLAGEAIFNLSSNIPLITDNIAITKFGTLTLTMMITAGLLTIKSELSDLDSGNSLSKTIAGAYGFLAAGLTLSAIFGFMSHTELLNLNSNFAIILVNFTAFFALAPAVVMISTSFIKKKKKK